MDTCYLPTNVIEYNPLASITQYHILLKEPWIMSGVLDMITNTFPIVSSTLQVENVVDVTYNFL